MIIHFADFCNGKLEQYVERAEGCNQNIILKEGDILFIEIISEQELKSERVNSFLTFWRNILSIIARQTEHIRDHLASLQTCVVVAFHKGDNS